MGATLLALGIAALAADLLYVTWTLLAELAALMRRWSS